MTIVIINAAIGFVQEYRADRAAAALTRLVAPRARVVRGGRLLVLPAADVVRGDVLQLDAGDPWPVTPGSSRPPRSGPRRRR